MNGLGEDRGDAPQAVSQILGAWQSGDASSAQVLAVLREARVFVPVVPLPATEGGKRGEIANVLLRGRDGRSALLAFTSLASINAWNDQARPKPSSTSRAAALALEEGATALVVDLAGPVTFPVEGEDLSGVAHGWELRAVGRSTAWIRPAQP